MRLRARPSQLSLADSHTCLACAARAHRLTLRALQPDGATPEGIADEVLVCHRTEWWEARAASSTPSIALRVDGGFLRFQDPKSTGFPLRREDVLAIASPTKPLARTVSRMLPGWITVRPALREDSK